MSYICKTDGATSGGPVEVRQGVITDVAAVDRDNWRQAMEVPFVPTDNTIRGNLEFHIQPDSTVQMRWATINVEPYVQAMKLKEYAAAARWAKSNGGIVAGGTAIDTSDASVSKLADALGALERGTLTTVEFKSKSGWVVLDATAMRAVYDAVVIYVQACYSAEQAIDIAIDAGTITTKAEIDAFAWPATGA